MPAKILVVDDEVHLARIIQFMLEHEGFEVSIAFDGEEAIAKAWQENPDLIILDLMLPVIDGYRVCNILKEQEFFGDTPIMILSARDPGSEHLDEPPRADYFMSKPFNTEDLIDTIAALLSQRRHGMKVSGCPER
ncbi:MAG TPA: response regulator [Patescibacteria group bacterium]|nr:response regulator [Patescibacteria group bacterium]